MLEFTLQFANKTDKPQLLFGTPANNGLNEASNRIFKLNSDDVKLYCAGNIPTLYQMNFYLWHIAHSLNANLSFSSELPQSEEPWLHVLLQGYIEPKEFVANLTTSPKQGILTGSISQVLGKWGTWTAQISQNRLTVNIAATVPPPNSMPDQGMSSYTTANYAAVRVATLILQSMTLLSNTRLILSAYTTSREGQDFLNMGPGPFHSSDIVVMYGTQDDAHPLRPENFYDACDLLVNQALIFPEFRGIFRDYQSALELSSKDSDRLIYFWRAAEEILYIHDPNAKDDAAPKLKPAAENLKLFYETNDSNLWIKELGTFCHRFARHAGPRLGKASPEKIETCRLRVKELIIRHAQFRAGHSGNWDIPQKDALTGWLSST